MAGGETNRPQRIRPVQDPRVARRNKREQDRVRVIKQAYARLEAAIDPSMRPPCKPRLAQTPRLAVLRATIDYINNLAIQHDTLLDDPGTTTPSTADIMSEYGMGNLNIQMEHARAAMITNHNTSA